jgi:hypothetical protein
MFRTGEGSFDPRALSAVQHIRARVVADDLGAELQRLEQVRLPSPQPVDLGDERPGTLTEPESGL